MNTKKLGFGLMRLPCTDPADTKTVDHEAVCRMVDRFLAEGFTYFDTAAPYHGGSSETAFRTCIAERYPRDAYTITDKLSFIMVREAENLEEFFAGQLERCGVDYFDYYLLHAMDKEYLDLAEQIGAFDFVTRKKAEGKIRHLGFSFHSTPAVLEEILTRHPEMEYVQLQLNYVDWEDPDVQARECYEVCVRFGKPVIVMEPVKGGLLTSIPEEAEALLKASAPQMSTASWAIRFAASQENVFMVLSGMSDEAQVEDNLSYMKDFRPLSGEEQRLVTEKAVAIINSKVRIACTACRYCVDGCPQKIAIPSYFKLMNSISKFGDARIPHAKRAYDQKAKTSGKASDCIRCGQCEAHCPQHLPITTYLEDVVKTLEN